MITTKQMEKCIGENILITLVNGEKFSTHCEEYVPKVESDEEPVIFISNSLFVTQSEIKKIEIL